MRLTIVPEDSLVILDGNSSHRPLDLSTCGIPQDVHALQWYETEGEIEYDGKPKPPNEEITALPTWAEACVLVWNAWTPPAPAPTPTANQAQPTTTGTQAA
jgi:hypothetical protein